MRYTAKKIATMLLTMVIVSFLTFVAFSLLSGDAATRLLGTEATPERLEALRIELGLNDPLLVRYGRWLWDALRGDLGTSYRYGQSVSSLIAQRLGPTLTLTALTFALIVAVSIPFGVLSAKYAGGRLDRAGTAGWGTPWGRCWTSCAWRCRRFSPASSLPISSALCCICSSRARSRRAAWGITSVISSSPRSPSRCRVSP